jgi:hypothetical protein
VVAAITLAPGCALFRGRKAENPLPPQLVGSVGFVNEPLGFVLVDVGSLYSPAAGQALKAFRDGQETAVLAVTAERKRPFVSADIVRGAPRRGDAVYQ